MCSIWLSWSHASSSGQILKFYTFEGAKHLIKDSAILAENAYLKVLNPI
jgi:hypothetical protein